MIHRTLTLWLLLASLCWAQTKVLVIEGQPKEDVEKSYQLAPSVTGANAAKFNARIAATGHPVFFPEGQWRMEKTLVVPDITGLKISGSGQDRPMAEGQWGGSGWGGPTPRITYTGPRITFNGSTVTASSTSASATIKLTGYIVTSDDVGMVVEITGGTNFTSGWYYVESVTPGVGGTWTLNRDCTSGAGTAMVGIATHTLWRDEGVGTLYEGLAFRGHPTWLQPTMQRCVVGWHQTSNVASGENLNTGKANFRNCTFSDFRVGMLFGRNMDRAYARLADFDGNPQDYEGEFDNHADHPSTYKMKFVTNNTCLLVRNRHSVNHRHVDWHCTDCEEIFYFERGGQLFADQIELNRGTVLRLGVTNHNNNYFKIENITVDGQAQTFAMLRMDQEDRETNQTVIFDGGLIDGEVDASHYDANLPLWHAKSGTKLVIRNFRRLRPNCILLEETSGGEIPYLIVENCMLEGCTNQNDIINEESSTPGAKVTFSGNSNFDNTVVWAPEHYTIPTP